MEAHCDGFYSYFASPISWGSTPSNWAQAAGFAKSHSLIFAPSVGPGYVDTRVRPWNAAATRERSRSRYYDQVIPTPSHLLGRISPISSPFFLVCCAFSPPRRGGSNAPQAGAQGQETVSRAPKHRFSGPANSGCSDRG